jgi:hypothetical protein
MKNPTKLWKNINSAPKDGSEIIVREDKSEPPQFAHWRDDDHYLEGGFWAARESGLQRRLLPVRWMAIPRDDE